MAGEPKAAAMSFGAPLMLLGLLAVLVPIVIHLTNRRRAVRVAFPALSFLVRSNRKLARRLKLKQWALLAARIGVLLLIPLAMARPSIVGCGGDESATLDSRMPASVVYVVDDSGSTSAPDGGDTVYASIRARAEREVRGLRAWDQAAIVVASQPPRAIVSELTDDRSELLGALDEHVPSQGAADFSAALALAAEIQQGSRQPAQRTVVVSDGHGVGWPDTAPQLSTRALGLLDIAAVDAPEDNVAVVDVTTERSAEGGEGEHVIRGALRLWGAERTVDVRLVVDGEARGVERVALEADGTGTAAFTALLDGPGPFSVAVEVDGDTGAAIDDRYWVTVHPRRAVRVLIVNGDSRSVELNDEAFFLRRALGVSLEGRREIEAEVVAPAALESGDLDGFDVVVLANVAALAVPTVEALVAFTEAGGGVLISAGSNTDPERWNSLFGPLLPKPVRSVKALATPGAPDARVMATRLTELDVEHPALRVFAGAAGEPLRNALVYRYALLEPEADSDARVVATFADGGPALVERRVGQGLVMLWTTSLDLDWTDVPLATAYVPLVRRLSEVLARRSGGAERAVLLGDVVTLQAEASGATRLEVLGPDGARRVAAVSGGVARVTPTVTGVYAVSALDEAGSVRLPTLDFAVNAAPAESDPRRLEAELVAAWEAESEGTGGDADVSQGGTRVWPTLLLCGLLLLYAESLLATRRRLWVRLRERMTGGGSGDAI